MSDTVQIHAKDGHILDAYVSRPSGTPLGGIVLLQEIFGVNSHIRSVADGYAKDGYLVVAPALFDRSERHVSLTYEGRDRERAFELMKKLNIETALLDVQAAMELAEKETGTKPAVIGFCYGGLLAWLSSTRLHPAAAIGYYAGGIGNFATETPHAPTILHFGRKDSHIPKEQVDKVQQAHPDIEIFWYDADHAFNRDVGESYDAPSAKLARERTLLFLKKNLG